MRCGITLWVAEGIFYATRNTLSYEILETYKVGEQPQVRAQGAVQ